MSPNALLVKKIILHDKEGTRGRFCCPLVPQYYQLYLRQLRCPGAARPLHLQRCAVLLCTDASVATSVAIDGALGAVGKVAKHAVSGKYTKLSPVGRAIKKITYEPKYLNKKAVSTITTNIMKDFFVGLPVEVARRFTNRAYC